MTFGLWEKCHLAELKPCFWGLARRYGGLIFIKNNESAIYW